MVQPKHWAMGILGQDSPTKSFGPGPEEVRIHRSSSTGQGMIYVVVARTHDSFRTIKAYPSWGKASVMADIGYQLEVKEMTHRYITYARDAETDDEKAFWTDRMLDILAHSGITEWEYVVREMEFAL